MRLAILALLPLLLAVPAVAEDVAKERVSFETADGLTIVGDLWPSGMKGAPGVVALHMYRSDRTSWEPVAVRFARAGVDFLAIDMRGHGESAVQGEEDLSARVAARDGTLFNAMHDDAAAAVRFLVSRGTDGKRVALAGASVGCSVAIDTIGRDADIRGAAVLTPGTNYLDVPTMEHLQSFGARPLLILAAKGEADGGREIAKALGKRAELTTFEQDGIHGTRMFGKVPGVEELLVSWLADLVGGGLALDGEPDSAEDEVVRRGRWVSVRGDGEIFLGVIPENEPGKARGYRATADGVTELIRRDGEWIPIRMKRAAGMVAPRVRQGSCLELLVHLPPAATVRFTR